MQKMLQTGCSGNFSLGSMSLNTEGCRCHHIRPEVIGLWAFLNFIGNGNTGQVVNEISSNIFLVLAHVASDVQFRRNIKRFASVRSKIDDKSVELFRFLAPRLNLTQLFLFCFGLSRFNFSHGHKECSFGLGSKRNSLLEFSFRSNFDRWRYRLAADWCSYWSGCYYWGLRYLQLKR